MIKRSNGSLMSTHFVVAHHNMINVFPSPSPTGLSCHSLRTWWDGLLVYPPIWQYGHNTNINKVTQIQGLLHICLYNIDVLVFSYIPDIKRPKGERPEAPLEPIAYSHWGLVFDNQRVTWTAFTILAMFLKLLMKWYWRALHRHIQFISLPCVGGKG